MGATHVIDEVANNNEQRQCAQQRDPQDKLAVAAQVAQTAARLLAELIFGWDFNAWRGLSDGYAHGFIYSGFGIRDAWVNLGINQVEEQGGNRDRHDHPKDDAFDSEIVIRAD